MAARVATGGFSRLRAQPTLSIGLRVTRNRTRSAAVRRQLRHPRTTGPESLTKRARRIGCSSSLNEEKSPPGPRCNCFRFGRPPQFQLGSTFLLPREKKQRGQERGTVASVSTGSSNISVTVTMVVATVVVVVVLTVVVVAAMVHECV